jgi:type I restriction enzyme, S subunit
MNDAIPDRWKSAALRSLTYKIGSGATPRGGERAYKKSGIPLIRSMNVYCEGFRTDGLAYLDKEQAAALNGVKVRAGDVLLNITGASIGRVTQAPPEMDGARVNQHVCIIRPVKGIESSFVARFLASPSMQAFIAGENYGVTRQALTKEMIENIRLPIPPLEEQQRIVAKLDGLFDHSKRARGELSRIPRLIERYKQSVISAAMRDEEGMPWPSVALGDILLEGPTNGYSPRAGENPHGTLSLKLTATTRGVLDLTDRSVKRLNEVIPRNSKFWLKPGDILIQRANSLEYVGVTAIYDGPEHTYIYPDLMMRIRVKSPVLARWIWRCLNGEETRRYFIQNATGTAGNMPKINGSTIRQLRLPLPPENKIERILERLEYRLGAMDRIKHEADRAGCHVDRLDQATLAKAFRGELVEPQETVATQMVVLQ